MKKLFCSLFIALFLFAGYGVHSVEAAGTPQIFDIVVPEGYDPGGLNLFGAFDQNQQLPVVIDENASFPFTNLTISVNNDAIFGTVNDSTGNFIYAVYGEDNNPSGGGWDLYMTKLDSSGSTQPGWPVLLDASGGLPNTHAVNGLVKLVPDTSGGVYVLFFNGDDLTPQQNARIRHYNGAGTQSFSISQDFTNADMVADGSGGIFLLYQIGDTQDASFRGHGLVRHLTSSGIDFAWTTGGGFEFTVSTENTTNKQGATIMADRAGGGIVLWSEPDGVYGQRFDSNGDIAAGWATRGNLIYASAGGTHTLYRIRGSSSSVGHYYATFNEYGALTTMSFDGTGNSLWTCGTQTLGGSASDFEVFPSEDLSDPGVYVVFEDGNIAAQLYNETTGNSKWALGGVAVSSGSNQDFVFPNQEFLENKSSSMVSNAANTGFHAIYSNDDFFQQLPVVASVLPTTFAAGPGNDCVFAGSPPDAISDLVAIAGDTEVDLGWSAPNDNGSAITDYTIEFREFPGGVFGAFADGVSTSTSATVTGLTNGQEYEFRVFAINGNGTSAASNLEQATPASQGSGRRHIQTGGPQFFLGQVRDERGSQGALRGSARVDGVNELLGERYQSSGGVEGLRSFADDQELINRIGHDRTELLKLIDLIAALRELYSWMYPENYTLLNAQQEARSAAADLFLTRFFHHKIGVEYLERGNLSSYDFDYKYPVDSKTEILVDFARSTLLTVGRACYDPSVLDYAEELDYANSPNWYVRYVEVLRPWFEEIYGTSQFALIKPMDDIHVLDAYYLFLFGFCLGEELGLEL